MAQPRISVLPVPVPVPVFVPVPMNMYSQYTPKPVALPIPLPVPVFLPEKPSGSEPAVGEKIPTKSTEADSRSETDDGNESEGRQEDGYLFENGRVENIFSDRIYQKFATEFTKILKLFRPSLTDGGLVHSRVEEKFLWDCKQLGAYSPIVLLNTLLFFCCKYFGLTTVEQHRQLSFTNIRSCIRTNRDNSETAVVRFYLPASRTEAESDSEVVPRKKRRFNERGDEYLEITENTENPLRCPVRLFEFYLSKCSEAARRRSNVFYLLPDRSCAPSHQLWFSSTPLDDTTLEAMIVRTLIVRELQSDDKAGT
ncbi:zinc finger MYM-type protein 4-like [Xenentodon cancila]